MIRLIIAILVFLVIEVYAYMAFRTLFKSRWVAIGFEVVNILIIAFIVWSVLNFDRHTGQNKLSLFTAGLLLVTILPKIVLGFVMLGEDLYRVPVTIVNYFSDQKTFSGHIPERRKFVTQVAFGLAAIPFLGLLHGIFIGKYNFRVIKQSLAFNDLPTAFDGFKILQISDIHSGSFDNPEKINYAVDLINEQNADVIVFTGDIVNALANEMHPWIETFNRIKAPAHGKYSILGNHDYGEYLTWNSQEEKRNNFTAIKDLHRQIDFKLMLNEHAFLKKGSDRIALIGVENWGVNFKQAGDLTKASAGLGKDDFKVLLSHDPSHWENEVKRHANHYQLTLSGHTHGFQFGIEIPGIIKWSPVQYVYKQWAGLYQDFGRYIYVNRGLGFHAYPGRVGIWPEITVIELKKAGDAA